MGHGLPQQIQALAPHERWSKEAYLHTTWYDWLYVLVAAAINPMRSVTALEAASKMRGSKWSERVGCWRREGQRWNLMGVYGDRARERVNRIRRQGRLLHRHAYL